MNPRLDRSDRLARTVTLALLAASLGCPAGPSRFGEPVGSAPPTPIARLAAQPEAFADQTLIIEGRIDEVCQSAGCWCIVADGDARLHVSFPSFAIPFDSAGRRLRATGRMTSRAERPAFLATGIDLAP